jgi:acetyltransferase-like isoleucine patch superfamily enzyme
MLAMEARWRLPNDNIWLLVLNDIYGARMPKPDLFGVASATKVVMSAYPGTMMRSLKSGLWFARAELTEWSLALVRAIPGEIGASLRGWTYRRRLKHLGLNPSISQHVVIRHPEHVSIGNNVLINRGVILQGGGGLIIGDDVMIGPGVYIWSINHGFADCDRPIRLQGYTESPVTIEQDVWLAAGCIVLPGAVIRRGAVIAAGAVVRGEIPANSIAGGVPAKVIGSRSGSFHSTGTDHASSVTDGERPCS